MSAFIEFCSFIFNRIVAILNSISFGDSPSLLKFILSAIIIGFVIKLIKGSANEFDHSMNFSTGSIVHSAASKYQRNSSRKQQLINNQINPSTTYLRLSPSQAHHFGGRTKVSLQEYNDRFKD